MDGRWATLASQVFTIKDRLHGDDSLLSNKIVVMFYSDIIQNRQPEFGGTAEIVGNPQESLDDDGRNDAEWEGGDWSKFVSHLLL